MKPTNRYIICTECDGSGKVMIGDAKHCKIIKCPDCMGLGYISNPYNYENPKWRLLCPLEQNLLSQSMTKLSKI